MVVTTVPKAIPIRVLLAESECELGAWLKRSLERVAYEVTECPCVTDLVRHCGPSTETGDLPLFDLMLCDARLLGKHTIELIRREQHQRRCPPLVLIDETGKAGGGWFQRLQISAVIDKPLGIRTYVSKLRELAPIRELNR